jgi:hypothetical protein
MSSWGSTASVTRITSVYILVRPGGERTILTAAATTATTAIASVDILVRSRWERTIGSAAAAAASHGAREWREQSHADGRRRHTEYDAQSSCDHCRPPLRATNPNCRSQLASVLAVARRDCGSAARPLQEIAGR